MDARWGFAFVLACPACTAGLFLTIAAVLGITAAALKGAVAVAALSGIGALWARNAWRRRGESCSPCHRSGADG